MTDTPEATTEPQVENTAPDEMDDPKGNREAAKYRRQLRAAEAERDALRTRLETMQRAAVEGIAGGSGNLIDGTDIWTAATLEDMLNEDGDVSAEAVTAAVDALATAKPHLRVPLTPSSTGMGRVGPPVPHNPEPDLSWANALRGL